VTFLIPIEVSSRDVGSDEVMRLLLARLGWSSFNWRGLPERASEDDVLRYSSDVKRATMSFIRTRGYGVEWWNFDEDFCKHFKFHGCEEKYYYGNVPRGSQRIEQSLREDPTFKEEDLMILFISRDTSSRDYRMKLVGVYCDARYLGNNIIIPIDEDYKKKLVRGLIEKASIDEMTKKAFISEFNDIIVIFKAPKEYSFVLPDDLKIEVNQKEFFGDSIRQFIDVKDITFKANYDRIISEFKRVLERINKDTELATKINYVITKLEELKNMKERKEQLEREIAEVTRERVTPRFYVEYEPIISSKECADALCEIGSILGYYCAKEYGIGGYRVDVVWKKVEYGEPFVIFEILHTGDPEKDVSSLQTISSIILPGSIPVWVVHPDNFEAAQRILERRFLAERIILMTFDDIAEILAYLRKIYGKLMEYNLEKLLSREYYG